MIATSRRWIFVLIYGVFIVSTDGRTASAAVSSDWTDDSTVYRRDDYGFSFSYPATWHLYENVKTRYTARGLPSVFNLCLTPGFVKTLSCEAELYVIPQAKFVPPAQNFFLGLPLVDTDSVKAAPGLFREEPFSIAYSTKGPSTDRSTNYSLIQNGYVFLWVQHGEFNQQELWNSMLSSFQFFLPDPSEPTR